MGAADAPSQPPLRGGPVGVVGDGVADGTLQVTGEPRVVAYGLLGMVAWSHRWFNPHTSAVSAREIAETFADTVIAGLVRSP